MSNERLNDACRLAGDAKDIGLVRTRDRFEITFDVWSKTNDCAASNILECSGCHIWGVLYEVPDHLIDRATSGDRKSFDAIEGKKYRRRQIAVVWPDGTPVPDHVVTYTVREPVAGLRTSLTYVSYILRGLREHNASSDYVAYVKNRIIANNPDLATAIEAF